MIINGDAFVELPKIEDNSIDLVIIDPPYLISKDSGFKNVSDSLPDNLKKKYGNISIDFGYWDKGELDWEILFKEYYRVLKKSGTIIVFYDIWKSNTIKSMAELNKFKQPRVCSWVKSNPVPINSKLNYLSNSTEYFFTFVKGRKPTFNSVYDNGIYSYPICSGRERTKHPTQKPLSLIKSLIEKHSNEGDMVLDTFSGSGTTAISCIELNREYICIEKDIEYYNISINRIEQLA